MRKKATFCKTIFFLLKKRKKKYITAAEVAEGNEKTVAPKKPLYYALSLYLQYSASLFKHRHVLYFLLKTAHKEDLNRPTHRQPTAVAVD